MNELIKKIKKMSEDELVAQSARGGEPNPHVFSIELVRRSFKYTRRSFWLTIIVMILVLIQIYLAFIQ
jgi:hypothetical protein